MEYLLITFAYISLFVTLFWLQIMLITQERKHTPSHYPKVTITIPAWNEEHTIAATIQSALALQYPKHKLQIIVVDDGSTDNTAAVAKKYPVLVITQKNQGKAAALNTGIAHATGELFACLDADSYVEPDALKRLIPYFSDKKLGGVICAIRVNQPKTILEKLQWFEYIMAAFVRKLMARIEALFITPGVLSLYRTHVLKQLGGFALNNLTEDFEMALKLHYNHYRVKIETQSIGKTTVPDTFKTLLNQRVRWFRGFITNTLTYRTMFFNKNYGMLGTFQLPLAVLSVLMLLTSFSIFGFRFLKKIFYTFWDFINLQTDFFSLFELPTLKTLLNLDYLLIFPIIIGIGLVIFFLYKAHQDAKEHFRYPATFVLYLLYYSIMLAICWVTAIAKEGFKAKKTW